MKLLTSKNIQWISVVCILLAGLVGGLLPYLVTNSLRPASELDPVTDSLLFVGICVLTGVLEEALFRFALMRGAVYLGCSWPRAVFISTLLFGLAHLNLPSAALGGNPIAWAQCALKVVQGCAFGYLVAAWYARSRKLWQCMLLHIAFDLLYFAPVFITTGAFPVAYTSGLLGDLIGLIVSTALLVLAAGFVWAKWRRG